MKSRKQKERDTSANMDRKEIFKKIVKWSALLLSGGILLLFALFIFHYWDTLWEILFSQNPAEELQDFIAGFGIWAAVLLILFQSLQIILAFLPGEPIELVSGMMYGGFGGALLCLGGVVIGTYVVFFAVQKFGSGLITAFHDEKKVKKLNRLAIFHDAKNAELLTFLLFLVPGLPKDFFTFLAPLTPISIHRFVLISTLGRAPGMLITTYAGVSLLSGRFLLAGCLYGALALCAVIGMIYYRKMLKSQKDTDTDV